MISSTIYLTGKGAEVYSGVDSFGVVKVPATVYVPSLVGGASILSRPHYLNQKNRYDSYALLAYDNNPEDLENSTIRETVFGKFDGVGCFLYDETKSVLEKFVDGKWIAL